MNDNLADIAANLITEHGLVATKEIVQGGVMDALDIGDNYRLSIWRDVRRVLEAWTKPADT